MSVILKPLITEKSMKDVKSGKFTFAVDKSADKRTIKREIEKKFNVNIVSISTNITKGRKKRFGLKRTEKSLPAVKKAVVTLKVGEKIDLFDVGAQ